MPKVQPMTIKIIIPIYLDYCENQKQLDPKTQKAYRIDLTQLAEAVNGYDVKEITSDLLESVFTKWHQTGKPKTVKRKIASTKAFFHWMEEKEWIEKNPIHKIHTHFREPKVLPKTISDHVLTQFLQILYDARNEAKTDTAKKGVLRDIAVIELLFGTGIRISELCSLQIEDINLIEGEVLIHGKGRKERLIQIPDEDLLQLLTDYTQTFQIKDGYFFRNNRNQVLSDQSVRNMIQKYANKAGITQHITPHMFRHTFATSLLDADVNLRCIQELLGHSSIQTTEIYTHVSAAKQRQILKDCHPRKQIEIKT